MCGNGRERWNLKSLLRKQGRSPLSSLATQQLETLSQTRSREPTYTLFYLHILPAKTLKLCMKASNIWNDLERLTSVQKNPLLFKITRCEDLREQKKLWDKQQRQMDGCWSRGVHIKDKTRGWNEVRASKTKTGRRKIHLTEYREEKAEAKTNGVNGQRDKCVGETQVL